VLDVGGRKQLFLDHQILAGTQRISRLMGRPDKYARKPVIAADRPWETEKGENFDGVQISGQSVIYDAEERLFKMWYNPWANGVRPWCYAVSRDGYAWEKPSLGIHSFQGSKDNNIMGAWKDVKFFNVFKDVAEKDPQRRYKAMGESEGRTRETSGTAVAFSPDGVRWTPHPGNPVVLKGRDIADCPTFLGWDARLRKYVYYPRPGHPIAPEIGGWGIETPHDRMNLNAVHLRAIGYSTSDDFVRWTPTELMLAPDEHDRADAQYYQMTVAQEGELYIGIMHMYHSHDKTFEIYLLSSRDGFEWNWIDRRLPFMPRGEIGTYDGGYLTPSAPILQGDKVWIYYGAYSGAHSYLTTKYGPNHGTIALATLPKDRYLGLLAGPNVGTIETRPLLFRGSKLVLDLDAEVPDSLNKRHRDFEGCEVRVEISDQSGRRLDGFTLDRSTPITAGGAREVVWPGGDLRRLEGSAVRVRIELRNAALYSLQFV
jgi:hypothetical protein